MNRLRIPTTLLLAIVAASCDAGVADPEERIAGFAGSYLNDALDIMEFNSVRRFEIDWDDFREQAFVDAGPAQTTFETYPAIEASLERIDDGHSFFRPSPSAPAPAAATLPGLSGTTHPGVWGSTTDDGPARTDPMASLVADGIGYVDVPEFQGGGEEGNVLATEYHRLIESVDTLSETCRWIVDLRGNQGGNMWPMVAGVGPILGEGDVGSFVYPDSVELGWFYEAGDAGIGTAPVASVDSAYALASPMPHVAILHDTLTASSGEAVVVAFRGREKTRSFGEATWGVSTANQGFGLSDGAVLFLTVATLADRTGFVYGGKLEPDELVVGDKTGDPETDAALAAAIAWLNTQSCG